MEIRQTDLRQTAVLVAEVNGNEELFPLFDIDFIKEAMEVFELLNEVKESVKVKGLWKFENLKTISAMNDIEVLLNGFQDKSIKSVY